MTTLNQIADHIAGLLKMPFNVVLKDQIRFTLNYYRAEFIKQSLQRNYLDRMYFQTFITPLIEVDKGDNCYIEVGCTVLRTEKQLPEMIRTHGNPFKFIGSVGRDKQFALTDFEIIKYTKHNFVTNDEIRVAIRNMFGVVFGNTKLKFLEWEGLVVDPYSVNTCQTDCMTDDKPYPIPADMLRVIINGIVSGEFRLIAGTGANDEEAKLEKKAGE